MSKGDDELRRMIAGVRDTSESASKVALKALRAVEREGKRRRDQMRELRSRLTTLELRVPKPRAR